MPTVVWTCAHRRHKTASVHEVCHLGTSP